MNNKIFDLIILGGGHAGIEAAYCAAQFDISIAIITMPGVGLASAPCNPSIGGIGKGQIVKEIDAMGGLMGILTDKAGIQYRTLNESKGLAVRSTRVQIDKDLYSQIAEEEISKLDNIVVIREIISKIERDLDGFAVESASGANFYCKKLLLTTGTFLGGKLHCGSAVSEGGRVDVSASNSLSGLLSLIKMKPKRFKTGTPARISSASIDYTQVEEQPSDALTRNMHLWSEDFARNQRQVSCYLTRTNSETMKIIRDNKEKSPMYNGQISAIGARYCPSIEDKAYRYPDKDIHHVFLEPEGLDLDTVYPSGISTSLPQEVQKEFINTILGLSNAEISKPGYAVEYDVVDSCELNAAFEHKNVEGLYFAGQVNGTSGYEEAAAQGLVAGMNAALSLKGQKPLVFDRSDSYIGLLVFDLIGSDRDEPYRLFTARSENRLFLREDNAFLRMKPYRAALNLSKKHDLLLKNLVLEYEVCVEWLESLVMGSDWRGFLTNKGISDTEMMPKDLLKDPSRDPRAELDEICAFYSIQFSSQTRTAVAIHVKYDGYIKKSQTENQKVANLEKKVLNIDLLLASNNISFECKQRIAKFRPETFGQLKRTAGIRPATLAVVASNHL